MSPVLQDVSVNSMSVQPRVYSLCPVTCREFRVNLSSVLHTTDGELSRSEMDSHAEVCVVGSEALIVNDFERPVTISGYDPGDHRLRTRLCLRP